MRSSANHADDVPLVFGAHFMTDEGEPDLWTGKCADSEYYMSTHALSTLC